MKLENFLTVNKEKTWNKHATNKTDLSPLSAELLLNW